MSHYVTAGSIRFTYDSKKDSLTIYGDGVLEHEHVKNIMRKYPYTKKVYVGGNINGVGYKVFSDCNNVETIIFSSSVKGNAFLPIDNCKKLSKVVLPENYEFISCFVANCPKLESFVVPDSVKVIKELSSNCPFKNLHIGKSVVEIVGDYGANSEHLTSISVTPGNKLFFSKDGVLYSYSENTQRYSAKDADKGNVPVLVVYPPEKKDTTFYFNYPQIRSINNKYIKEICLGKEFRQWGECNMPSLKRILVDEENDFFVVQENFLLDKGKTNVIAYASGISERSCELPPGVEGVGAYSFYACQFDTLIFPKSITRIAEKAVCSCDKLRYIEMNWQNPQDVVLDSNPFYEIETDKIIMKVPEGTKELYDDLFNRRLGNRFMVIERKFIKVAR